MSEYQRKNPWKICNLQNSQALCGRFPTQEAAEKRAAEYRGGVVSVNKIQKVVYVSEIPSL